MSRRFEGGTAAMPARLAAMRAMAQAGYPVGLTIAPIMPLDDWRADYGRLLDATAAALDGTGDVDLTAEIITHRFTPSSKDVLLGWYPATKLEMDEDARSQKRSKFGGVKYVYPKRRDGRPALRYRGPAGRAPAPGPHPLLDLTSPAGFPQLRAISGIIGDMDAGGASPRVLVVDDDQDVLASLERGLRLSGFTVLTAADGAIALRVIADVEPDALVLDMNMPVLDGTGVVTALRGMGNDIPICVLSARSSVDDRIAGLESGADDYLVKPFVLAELVARIRAMLRRRSAAAGPGTEPPLTVGPLSIDLSGRRVWLDDTEIPLTKREFELLEVLARNAGVVLSRERLLDLVWGYDFVADTNVVDVFVGYLRRKFETDGTPRLLHTVRGVGFVLRMQ